MSSPSSSPERSSPERENIANILSAESQDDDTSLNADIVAGSNPDDLDHDAASISEESEGEDLLDEDVILRDYEAIDELDQYDARHLDDAEYDDIDMDARMAAERSMRARDDEFERAQGRLPAALDDLSDTVEEDEPRKRRRITELDDADMLAGDEAELLDDTELERVDLDAHNGPAALFLALEPTRREIKRRLYDFFRSFQLDPAKPRKQAHYVRKIREMAELNKSTLVIEFQHLATATTPALIRWIGDQPELMFELLDEAAYSYTVYLHPSYASISNEVHVRISRLPIKDEIRDLRERHLNSLVKVEGVVTRRTAVFPQLQRVMLTCPRCQTGIGPFVQHDNEEIPVHACHECGYNGSMPVNVSETVWRNYQKLTLQEPPAQVPAGRVPRTKDIVLLHDLIDSVTPGEQVEVTGIYKHTYDRALNLQNGFPVFSTIIVANHIASHKEISEASLTEEEERHIKHLAKQPNIAQRIYASIGPSVYGHQHIKQALAMAMFGGSAKEFDNGHRIRGDINVLMLGDPGTAKSQFLKYVEKTSHRGIYTTGKGASAVGLTAAVHRDPFTREWTLEGGALVLADQGVCCIDEFDKMNDQDRTSIHEAMEQQSISISKAGIITTLKARCSVIAAANPVTGRYNSSIPFSDNVELTDAILSRFDILCVVRDTVDREADERLARFVVDSHFRAHPASQLQRSDELNQYEAAVREAQLNGNDEPAMPETLRELLGVDNHLNVSDVEPIEPALFRKYIRYAKSHYTPSLERIDDDKIASLYAKLRRESFVSGGLPISVRHIESIIRMSEAHAKMHLRAAVTSVDIDAAIKVMLESFISTQKFSIMRSLRKAFDQYLTAGEDSHQLILFTLNGMVNEAIQMRVMRRNNYYDADANMVTLTDDDDLAAVKAPVILSTDAIMDKLKDMNVNEAQFHSFLSSSTAKTNLITLEGKRIVKRYS